MCEWRQQRSACGCVQDREGALRSAGALVLFPSLHSLPGSSPSFFIIIFDSSLSPLPPAVYRYWALKTPPTSHRPTTSTSAFFELLCLPIPPPLDPPTPAPPPPPVFSIYGPEFVPGYNGADYRRPSGTAPQPRREPDASNWSLLIRLTACSDRLSTKSDNCE